jgi:hypothetical protein
VVGRFSRKDYESAKRREEGIGAVVAPMIYLLYKGRKAKDKQAEIPMSR